MATILIPHIILLHHSGAKRASHNQSVQSYASKAQGVNTSMAMGKRPTTAMNKHHPTQQYGYIMQSISSAIDEQKLLRIINDSNSRRRKTGHGFINFSHANNMYGGPKSVEGSRQISRANSRTNLHRGGRPSVGVDSSTLTLENFGAFHHNRSIAYTGKAAELPKGILRKDSAPKISQTGNNSRERQRKVSIEKPPFQVPSSVNYSTLTASKSSFATVAKGIQRRQSKSRAQQYVDDPCYNSGIGIISHGESTIQEGGRSCYQGNMSNGKDKNFRHCRRNNQGTVQLQASMGSTGDHSSKSASMQTSILQNIMYQLDPNRPIHVDDEPQFQLQQVQINPMYQLQRSGEKQGSNPRFGSRSGSKIRVKNLPLNTKNIQPKVNTNLKRIGSDLGVQFSSSKPSEFCIEQQQNGKEIKFNQVTRLGSGLNINRNFLLEQEININLGTDVQGEIRGNVNTKYADLERLLSMNLGDGEKDIIYHQQAKIPPRPNTSQGRHQDARRAKHNSSVHSNHQYSTIQHQTIDQSNEISMFDSHEKKRSMSKNRSNERPRSQSKTIPASATKSNYFKTFHPTRQPPMRFTSSNPWASTTSKNASLTRQSDLQAKLLSHNSLERSTGKFTGQKKLQNPFSLLSEQQNINSCT